jgi:hypothetical protein
MTQDRDHGSNITDPSPPTGNLLLDLDYRALDVLKQDASDCMDAMTAGQRG